MRRLLEFAYRARRLLRIPIYKALLHGRPYFFHYTPDVSGGVASWLHTFAQTFSDYDHLILCSRGTNTPSASVLKCSTNVHLAGHVNRKEAVLWARIIDQPAGLFNHVFWDLMPITKAHLEHSEFPVVALLHGRDSKLTCRPHELDKLVVFSRHHEEIYNACNLPGRWSTIVIPLAVNTEHFASIHPLCHNGTFVIGNVTNGAPWKHSNDFVSLCLAIRDAVPDAMFAFLGAKDLRTTLVDSDGFRVFRPYSVDVSDYFARINVLIHKTRADVSETWCLAVTEAMAAGIPVIVEAKGGLLDQVVHGETGFLCQHNEDFVRYTQLLYEDEELYWRISANARRHVEENFSIEVYRERIEKQLLE